MSVRARSAVDLRVVIASRPGVEDDERIVGVLMDELDEDTAA
jgi:hypothetical protein